MGFITALLILLLFEAGFRLIGLFPFDLGNRVFRDYLRYNKAFTVKTAKNGMLEYVTSDKFMHPQKFSQDKKPGSIRIFCLGGSTVYGYGLNDNFAPHEAHVPLELTFPHLLQEKLSKAFPKQHFEVINAGRSGYNSSKLSATATELLQYSPDFMIIYTGHNDYLHSDFLTVPNTRLLFRISEQFPFFSHLYDFFHSLRLYRALTALTTRLRPDNRHIDEIEYQQQKVQLDEEIAKNFATNFQAIQTVLKKDGIQTIISTLSSNVRDKPPFESLFSKKLSYKERIRFTNHLTSAWTLARWGQRIPALYEYKKAIDIAPYHARTHYLLARLQEAEGDIADARIEYQMAKELDMASTEAKAVINRTIRNFARDKNVPMADIERLFKERSPNEIPGFNLFSDQFHPNEQGHLLMTEAYFKVIIPLLNQRSQQ